VRVYISETTTLKGWSRQWYKSTLSYKDWWWGVEGPLWGWTLCAFHSWESHDAYLFQYTIFWN